METPDAVDYKVNVKEACAYVNPFFSSDFSVNFGMNVTNINQALGEVRLQRAVEALEQNPELSKEYAVRLNIRGNISKLPLSVFLERAGRLALYGFE